VFPYCGGAIKQPTQAEWLSACKAAKMRYAHLAPGHLAPYAGNSGLAEPQDVEIDQAQNRTHEVRVADDEEEEILLHHEWGG